MIKQFALSALLLSAAACAHQEPVPEAAATPTYRPEDLAEATGSIFGGGRHLDDRVAVLESQVSALKVEMSRVSGATQRLEARQLQAMGVTPEPHSKAASLDKPAKHKAKPAAQAAKAAPEDPRDPWAGAPPQADAPKHEAKADAPPAEQHVASAAPVHADTAAPQPPAAHAEAAAEPLQTAVAAAPPAETAQSYAVQLGAFGSAERAGSSWEALKSKSGPLLADLLPKREETSVGGKPVFRLKAGPISDRASAEKRCASLKAQGVSCIVTVFSGDWPSS